MVADQVLTASRFVDVDRDINHQSLKSPSGGFFITENDGKSKNIH
jgi:hypothetical protein